MSVSFDFRGKVVLITGASSGIGAHVAQQFAKSGAQIAITGRNESRLAAVARECVALSPTKLKPLQVVMDISRGDVSTLVTKTVAAYGKLDILINNAGIIVFESLNSELFEENFDDVMQLNLKSVLLLSRAAAPHLMASKGSIVNVSSVASTMPGVGLMAYSCAKAGIEIATQILAKELKGVRVNCIRPAIIHTPMIDALGEKETVQALLDVTSKRYTVGRYGLPQDTSVAILFLTSSDASFLTGVILPVAGGADLVSASEDALEMTVEAN
ncbi:3-oxoacyl-[acyl-carrier-protein] reductase FabG [Halotydeus destructor]|nr:3-oxoacyl-[acyl-carrier-protein] reductase FabG [Halotydeus destructor]